MRSRVGWCCQTALPQHIHCAFFETTSISLREISFVIINRTRAGACLLLTEKPPQPVRVQRLELRSLKFRRSIHVCLRTPAALHDHKSCGSKRPHLPHPRLHARLELRAPTLMRHAASAVLPLCLSFVSSPFPSVIPLASVRNQYKICPISIYILPHDHGPVNP